jgi:glycosyltransferase involved in cell wall biosynthesis
MKTPGVKVSVILPVYNVEPYLDECLMSIIKQTMTDIEIICINDGSTDGSANLLKKYAEKDSRIIIVNQQNAGAGAARNNGMRLARGEYLSFLDADDFFELTMLEEAYHRCKKFDADFVVFRSNAYISDPPRFKPTLWTIKDDLLPDKKVFNYKDIKKDIFKVFNGWAWDKLYKRNFIVSNNLYFQEQRSTNDLLFVFSALVSAKRITVLQNTLAHHRTNLSDSISVTREKSWECFYFA